jgi:hypothetical protein
MHERDYLARYDPRAAEALRSAEMSELLRLEAKFRVPPAIERATPSLDATLRDTTEGPSRFSVLFRSDEPLLADIVTLTKLQKEM